PAGVMQIRRSKFSNIAGVTVDDDGSLYYQLVDLIQFTGASIFKATELCRNVTACEGATLPVSPPTKPIGNAGGGLGNPRINRVIPSIPDPPTLGSWVGTTANPINVSNGVRNTNYGGGLSTLSGHIVRLRKGRWNVT